MGITFDDEVSKVKNKAGNWLKFDFEITYDNKTLYIEYDGQQHFKAVKPWGGLKALKKAQRHDLKKDMWCEQHGHPILRIPYTQFGNIPQLITEFICANTSWGVEPVKYNLVI